MVVEISLILAGRCAHSQNRPSETPQFLQLFGNPFFKKLKKLRCFTRLQFPTLEKPKENQCFVAPTLEKPKENQCFVAPTLEKPKENQCFGVCARAWLGWGGDPKNLKLRGGSGQVKKVTLLLRSFSNSR